MVAYRAKICPICKNVSLRCKCEHGSRIYDENWKTRQKAIQILGRKQLTIAIPHIIKALGDEYPEVRAEAASSLGFIRSKEATLPLCESLKDSDENVRIEALKSLRKLKDPRSISYLIESYKDIPNVREEAEITLRAIKHPNAVKEIKKIYSSEKNKDVKIILYDILLNIDHGNAAKLLLEMQTKETDSFFRKHILKTVSKTKNVRFIDSLILALYSEAAEIRAFAAEFLGELNNADAVKSLIKIASYDTDDYVRIKACDALTNISDIKALDMLLEFLEDDDERIRRVCVRCLDNYYSIRIITPLIKRLVYEPVEEIKLLIEEVLKNKNQTELIKKMLELLKQGSRYLKKTIADKLVLLNWKPSSTEEKVLYFFAKEEWSELVKLGNSSVEYLLEGLKDEDENIRAEAADCLGQIGDLRAEDPLIGLLKDESYVVRSWVAKSLDGLKSEKATEALLDAIDDDHEEVGLIALEAVIHSDSLLVTKKLLNVLFYHENPNFREAAERCISEVTNDYLIDNLVLYLENTDDNKRDIAFKYLKEKEWVPRTEKEEILALLISRDWSNLEKKGKSAESLLVKGLSFNDLDIVTNCIFLLQEIKSSRAVDSLINLLTNKDENIRRISAKALGEIGDERAVKALIKTTLDKDSDVQESSIYALGKMEHPKALETIINFSETGSGGLKDAADLVIGTIAESYPIKTLKQHIEGSIPELQQWAIKVISLDKSSEALEEIFKLIESEVENHRLEAVKALGSCNEKKCIELLLRSMALDESSEIKILAEQALLEQEGKIIEDELVNFLFDDDDNLGKSVVSILYQKMNEKLMDILIKEFANKQRKNRWRVIEVFNELKNLLIFNLLINALEDEDELVRLHAVKSLLEIKDIKSVEPLQGLLERETNSQIMELIKKNIDMMVYWRNRI